jgi:hypothetical protein
MCILVSSTNMYFSALVQCCFFYILTFRIGPCGNVYKLKQFHFVKIIFPLLTCPTVAPACTYFVSPCYFINYFTLSRVLFKLHFSEFCVSWNIKFPVARQCDVLQERWNLLVILKKLIYIKMNKRRSGGNLLMNTAVKINSSGKGFSFNVSSFSILCLSFRASWISFKKFQPDDTVQYFIISCKSLYMFRAYPMPIIRSSQHLG